MENNNEYYCRYCNKRCKSNLSKSCHERFCDLNPNKVSKEYLRQNAINTNNLLRNKNKSYKKELILYKHTCEYCKKEFEIYINNFKSYLPKCCSTSCAHKLSILNDDKKETKDAICIKCGDKIKINKRASTKTCICDKCKQEKIDKEKQEKLNKFNNKKINKISKITINHNTNNKRILTPESIEKLREAGKKSAKKQAENRRSKNEISFCNLCEKYFNNVIHNKPIFNGWDADVILPDFKIAILWNGKVHYEPIFGEANFNRVKNRDKIKINEIYKSGYIPYIIKDVGKYKDTFVKEKFDEFIKYLKNNNIL